LREGQGKPKEAPGNSGSDTGNPKDQQEICQNLLASNPSETEDHVNKTLEETKANSGARVKWLSVSNQQNASYTSVFQNYKLVADIYNDKNIDRINLHQPKDHVMEGLTGQIKTTFKNIRAAVARAATQMFQDTIVDQLEFPQKAENTDLHYICLAIEKGASFLYKELILQKAVQRNLLIAPAFFTWPDKLHHNMTHNDCFKALDKMKTLYVSPCVKWCVHQIFYLQFGQPPRQQMHPMGPQQQYVLTAPVLHLTDFICLYIVC
jgi:hypothetical protein